MLKNYLSLSKHIFVSNTYLGTKLMSEDVLDKTR